MLTSQSSKSFVEKAPRLPKRPGNEPFILTIAALYSSLLAAIA